ncbi:MAG: S8 family serine peptidase [Clostridiales bacterium]|jgi:alpha-tubulin suppressor-like RCC1 family protein/subtilisin family serine protease|nr:S8 family serine peptidase [Clostridiales bacterium]
MEKFTIMSKRVLPLLLTFLLLICVMPHMDIFAAGSGYIPPETSTYTGAEFAPDKVLAPADTMEEAQAIAAAYGLELDSYADGVAAFAASSPQQMVALSRAVSQAAGPDSPLAGFGLPQLSFNYIYTLSNIEYNTDDLTGFEITKANKQESTQNSTLNTQNWAAKQTVPLIPSGSIHWHLRVMDCDLAWDINQGEGVVVAVIDTGANTGHPKFEGQILEEYAYNSHTQEKGIKYVQDDYGHGTQVSGIVAASLEDNNSAYGVAPKAKLMLIKTNIPDDPRHIETVSWVRGLNYAVENGADIVNCSFGRNYDDDDEDPDKIEHIAIQKAVEKGVTVVCSAGNERYNHADFPAAYPEAIAVSALRLSGAKRALFESSYSNFGPEIDISAPGTGIYTTIKEGGYWFFNGTSAASPCVAGVAALIKSQFPEYGPEQIRQVLCETARKAGEPDRNDYYGHGIVNAYAAVLGITQQKYRAVYLGSEGFFNENFGIKAAYEIAPSVGPLEAGGIYDITVDDGLVTDAIISRIAEGEFGSQGHFEGAITQIIPNMIFQWLITLANGATYAFPEVMEITHGFFRLNRSADSAAVEQIRFADLEIHDNVKMYAYPAEQYRLEVLDSLYVIVDEGEEPVTLADIEVKTLPGKLEYNKGEALDLTDLVITAIYSNGSEIAVTAYTTEPAGGAKLLSGGRQTVTVTYTEKGITKTAGLEITVRKPVEDIINVPGWAMPGIPLALTGTVMPEDAVNKEMIWSLKDAGMTGASLSGNILTPAAPGTAIVTAAIRDGSTSGAVTAVASGSFYTLALNRDGSLWAFGYNLFGELGDGTVIQRNTPVRVGTDNDWATVAAGRSVSAHSLALKTDGSLWAWGYNSYGQLGLGEKTTCQLTPAPVGTDKDWAAISAGNEHTIALKTDGSLWAWGSNREGQLGNGVGSGEYPDPIRVGADSIWIAVAAGGRHTLAVKKDGSLWAWGWNTTGQLGIGTTAQSNAPVRVGSDNDWIAVSANREHSIALKTDGSLWAWGNNRYGKLGDGTETQRLNPVRVGSDHDWAEISAGNDHTIALKRDGSLWAWGNNDSGQLGNNPATGSTIPVRTGTDNDWTAISAGYHSMGLKTGASLWGWGDNSGGQLGNGTGKQGNFPEEIAVISCVPFSKDFIITVSPAGAKVSGMIRTYRTYDPESAAVIRLIQGSNLVYTAEIATAISPGQAGQEFKFESVAPGIYTLVITKPQHTKFTINNIIVGEEGIDMTKDSRSEVQLMTLRCGDINGDGLINDADLTVLWRSGNYNRKANEAENPWCDLNGDGLINDADLTILWMAYNYNRGSIVI